MKDRNPLPEGEFPRSPWLRPDFHHFFDDLPDDLRAPDPQSPRGRILAAARALFSESGFDRASTRAIADAARVNQAMIHYYYGTKEKLYRKVISLEILSVARAVIGRLQAAGDPASVLVRLPLEVMEELRADPVRVRLLRRELGRGGSNAARAVEGMGDHGPRGLRHVLASVLEAGRQSGRVRDLRADGVLPFLISVAYGSMLLEPVFETVLGESAQDLAVWSDRKDAFERILRGGLLIEEKES